MERLAHRSVVECNLTLFNHDERFMYVSHGSTWYFQDWDHANGTLRVVAKASAFR